MAQLLPVTRTTHAFSYSVQFNGKEIGNLQSFAPSSTTTLTRIRHLKSNTNAGETQEIMPSITDHQITVAALEIYTKKIMEEMGYVKFSSIEDLKTPIDIIETISAPDGSTQVINYLGCRVNTFNKSGITATGNVVTDNVVFWVTKITSPDRDVSAITSQIVDAFKKLF